MLKKNYFLFAALGLGLYGCAQTQLKSPPSGAAARSQVKSRTPSSGAAMRAQVKSPPPSPVAAARSQAKSITPPSGVVEPLQLKSYHPPSGQTVWNFDYPIKPFTASIGTATLSYFDPDNTGWGPGQTVFAKASELRLPKVNGRDATVMAFPACNPAQGYKVTLNSPPNGVDVMAGYVSNYTLVMDLLMPVASGKPYISLYQTSAQNDDDSEMFFENKQGGGGLGVAGTYNGTINTGAWHRVALSVQCAAALGGSGRVNKFIDGRFVGGQRTTGDGARCRWALDPGFLLFADNDGETGAGFLTSLMFSDRVLSLEEITALGGPSGKGANVPGPAAKKPLRRASRPVDVIAHRASTGGSPENTIAGIKRSFEAGADMVEVDVRLSADGVPVLMQDQDVGRTTNGSGPVYEKMLAELKKLDAGSWFDPRYAKERVPTLEEALRAAKGRGKLFLDVEGHNMGIPIKQALDKARVGPGAVVLSAGNSLDAADEWREHVPGTHIIWQGALPETSTAGLFKGLKLKGISGFNIDKDLVTTEFVTAAHANGMNVSVYTALDQDDILRLVDMGVDAIETDYPAALAAMLPSK